MEPLTPLMLAWCFVLAVPVAVALLITDRILWVTEYRHEMTARADQSLALADEAGLAALLEQPAPDPLFWEPGMRVLPRWPLFDLILDRR